MSKFEFPDCMHGMGAAFHIQNIDPSKVVISLPRDDWWRLQSSLDQKYNFALRYDGRGTLPDQFKYNGFTFKPL